MGQGVSAPKAVLKRVIADPLPRMQNVALTVEPPGLEAIEHHEGFSFVTGAQMRAMSVWSAPWWLTDEESAPTSGGFGPGFSSGFEGGIDSPQGAGFDSGFSAGFGG